MKYLHTCGQALTPKTKSCTYFQQRSCVPSHRHWSAECCRSGYHYRRCGWLLCRHHLGGRRWEQWHFSCDLGPRKAWWVHWGWFHLTGECSSGWCAPSKAGSRRSRGRCAHRRPAYHGHRRRCMRRCHGIDIVVHSHRFCPYRCWCLWVRASHKTDRNHVRALKGKQMLLKINSPLVSIGLEKHSSMPWILWSTFYSLLQVPTLLPGSVEDFNILELHTNAFS